MVIFSQASFGQSPPDIAPSNQAPIESPSSPGVKTTTQQPSVEPLTRQANESSMEITAADQRVMSEIQEIRAMLGGGLKSEFEEIDKALQQYRASAGSRATATLPFDFDRVRGSESRRRGGPDNRSPIPAGSLNANDRSGQGHERDWFSRELGEMVRSRSQSLAASDQDDSELIRQQEKSRQPVVGQGDTRGALRQCAQQLEAVAASLEQVEAYENADSVRREAAQLWEKARHP